jgi:hypothetical protein
MVKNYCHSRRFNREGCFIFCWHHFISLFYFFVGSILLVYFFVGPCKRYKGIIFTKEKRYFNIFLAFQHINKHKTDKIIFLSVLAFHLAYPLKFYKRYTYNLFQSSNHYTMFSDFATPSFVDLTVLCFLLFCGFH